MPRVGELPSDLHGLSLRNGLYVHHASFHRDMNKLVSELQRLSAEKQSKQRDGQ
jgi:hypothetical protein